MPGSFHWLRVQEFCYATEDRDRVLESFISLVGDEPDITTDISESEHGNTMEIIQCRMTHQREFRELFMRLGRQMVEDLISEVDDRIEGNNLFYLRLDKQKAVEGKWAVTHSGDSVAITGKVAANPAKREVAVGVLTDFLESLLPRFERAKGRSRN